MTTKNVRIHNHYKTICVPVRSDCSSCGVMLATLSLSPEGRRPFPPLTHRLSWVRPWSWQIICVGCFHSVRRINRRNINVREIKTLTTLWAWTKITSINKISIYTNNLQAVSQHDFVVKCKLSSIVCKKKLFSVLMYVSIFN